MFKLISRKGNFSIDFPGRPDFLYFEENTEYGKIFLNNFMYFNDEEELFLVSYGKLSKKQLEEIYASLQSKEFYNLLNEIGLKQLRLNNYLGNFGFYYEAKISEGLYITAQFYIVKENFYHIAIIRENTYADVREMNNFIGSFRLLVK